MPLGKTKRGEKIDFKHNLSHYYDILRDYKWLFIGILIISFIVEGTMTAEKYLFKIVVDKGTAFAAGELLKSQFVYILLILVAVFTGMSIFRVIGDWLKVHLLNRINGEMVYDLKRKFFNHLLGLSHSFHTDHKTGSLISRLVRSGRAMERMTDIMVFSFLNLFVNLIAVIGSLIYFSWVPALVITLTSISFVGYSLLVQHLQQDANVAENKAKDKEKANISDMFTNIDSIKYYGKERKVKNNFRKIAQSTKKAFLRHWDYFRWLDSGQSLILGIGTFFLLYFPITEFLTGNMEIGTLVFIYTVFGQLIGPLFMFVHGTRGFYRSMADFQALFKYSKIENEVKDKLGAKNLDIRNGEIKFNKVNFQYNKEGLFENFNLKIPASQKVALVGRSGCGKTTLVKLLFRLFDPDSGKITIDGEDIRDYRKESLRQEMSVVPQDCILFDDTIYNNVKFSRPSASKKEVREAMKFAQLDEIVERLPDGEDTIVGERGVKLSGGEKQRVSIARAILADRKVLVLDEATSSLDSHTEKEIQDDLEKLMKGRTSIMVAHRLSTIMNADKIVVLRDGEIVQQGTHRELINKKGEYRKLWNLQKGGYIE